MDNIFILLLERNLLQWKLDIDDVVIALGSCLRTAVWSNIGAPLGVMVACVQLWLWKSSISHYWHAPSRGQLWLWCLPSPHYWYVRIQNWYSRFLVRSSRVPSAY